jgi:transposase
MAIPETCIGIDVSKAWLDVIQGPDGTPWRVPNTPAGWERLRAALGTIPAPLIVLEATGNLHVGVTVALDAAGLTPAVVNPLSVRRFGQSLGQHAKTDRTDARLLATYGERLRPVPRPVPTETARTLQALVSRRQELTKLIVMETNRRTTADPVVRPSIAAVLTLLTGQQRTLDRQIATVIASDPGLAARLAQLTSVPGIGPVIGATLVASLPELGTTTGAQISALVGLAPYARDSGAQRGQRCIHGGRAPVRRSLYLAALTAIRRSLALRVHYQQLRARGKPFKVALIACARRLLRIINAMLRDGLTWDQTHVAQGRVQPPLA